MPMETKLEERLACVSSKLVNTMPKLPAGEVHVWIARIQAVPVAPSLIEMLDPVEREVAMRFRFEKHRQAYISAHAILRDILRRYLDRPAHKIQLGRDSFGKPFLLRDGIPIPPHFNLSHSGAMVLVALAHHNIGVDVEKIRPLDDIESLVNSNFSPQERADVLGQHPSHREQAFFRHWTRKESYIKALGQGMSIPLNSFDTHIPSGQSGRLLPGAAERSDVKAWWLADLELPDGYMGALTIEEGFNRILTLHWQPDDRYPLCWFAP
jgi:4'-phosphopantetheinyl transferase